MDRVLFHYTEALKRHPIARHYRNDLFFQLVDKMRFPLPEFFFFRPIWRAPSLSDSGRGLIESQQQSDVLKLTAAESFPVTLKSPSCGESTGKLPLSIDWATQMKRRFNKGLFLSTGGWMGVGLQGHLHEESFLHMTDDW